MMVMWAVWWVQSKATMDSIIAVTCLHSTLPCPTQQSKVNLHSP